MLLDETFLQVGNGAMN